MHDNHIEDCPALHAMFHNFCTTPTCRLSPSHPSTNRVTFKWKNHEQKLYFYKKIVTHEKQQWFVNLSLKKFLFSLNWNKKRHRLLLKVVIKFLVSRVFFSMGGTCYLFNLIRLNSSLFQTALQHPRFYLISRFWRNWGWKG